MSNFRRLTEYRPCPMRQHAALPSATLAVPRVPAIAVGLLAPHPESDVASNWSHSSPIDSDHASTTPSGRQGLQIGPMPMRLVSHSTNADCEGAHNPEFLSNHILSSCRSLVNDAGNAPVSLLESSFRLLRSIRLPSSPGTRPTNWL